MLGGVEQGLAGGRTEGGELLVDRGVADDHRVDDQRVVGLDLGHHARDQPGPGAALADHLRVVEPGAQLPLLAAGQPVDRLLVVGVPLDQRQGLQHRVVQVRGHGGALLGPDAGGALLGPGVEQPAPDRGGHEDDADEDDQRGREPVARVGQLTGGRQQQHHTDGGQHDASGQRPAHRRHGQRAVGVQLAPDDREPGGDQDQRQDQRRAALRQLADRRRGGDAEYGEDEQLTTSGTRTELDPPRFRHLAADGGHRHGQPEQPVGDDADPGRRQDGEGHPDDQRVLPQMGRGTGRHTGEQPARTDAHERRPWGRPAGRRPDRSGGHAIDRRTARPPADTGDHPR